MVGGVDCDTGEKLVWDGLKALSRHSNMIC
jgi:hypothetical protein